MSEHGGYYQEHQSGGPYGPPQPGQPRFGSPSYGPPQPGIPPYGHPVYGGAPIGPTDEMPGSVTAARVIMFIQGGFGAIVSALFLIGAIAFGAVSGSVSSLDDEIGQIFGTLGAGVTLVLLVCLAVAVAITVVTFLLAARFSRRRNSVRIGALVLEGVFGALYTASAVLSLAGGEGGGALSLVFAALCWAVFGILLTQHAKWYFNQ